MGISGVIWVIAKKIVLQPLIRGLWKVVTVGKRIHRAGQMAGILEGKWSEVRGFPGGSDGLRI